jgi:hypothetical protein
LLLLLLLLLLLCAQVKVLPEEELLSQAAGQGVVAERMGLTPDWIISTTAFMVFQLPVS